MWSMAYPLEGKPELVNRTALNPIAIEEAEFDFREYNNDQDVQDLSDQIVYQDWQLTAGQNRDAVRAVIKSRTWLLRKQGCGAFMRF